MTSPRHAWHPPDEEPSVVELREDRGREALLFWKGVLSLAVVVLVVWVRQRYLV